MADPDRPVVYWDASALMSALVADDHSEVAVETARRPLTHLMSTLAYAEVMAAVGRAESERRLDPPHAQGVRRLIRHGPWRRLMLQPDWSTIDTLGAQSALRGADLWHLACMSTLTRQLPEVRLFTFHERLIGAAARLGLAL